MAARYCFLLSGAFLYAGPLPRRPQQRDLAAALLMQEPTHAELASRLQAAEDAVRARDDFLAIAAHELRSPLHALALRMAVLERMAESDDPAVLVRELRRARRSVDRYVSRSVTLLDLSRLHAGHLRPAPARVRAADIVRNVVEDYRDEAEFHGAVLNADADEAVEGLWDAHMIEQIIANLVSNAIKYGNGSPVRVSARMTEAGEACIEVADQGPGIAESERSRIFDKFERIVSGGTDRAGFGLGLWIVGRMVAAHGGYIEVAEHPGGGSIFRVVLPLHPQPLTDTKHEQ